MLLSQINLHSLFFSTSSISFYRQCPLPLSLSPLTFLSTPTSFSCFKRLRLESLPQPTVMAAVEDEEEDEGPIELPPPSASSSSIFATTDDPTPLQVATSVLLTGAISIFLFRSLRRRARRVKELKFRSSGTQKSLKDEAMESLKAMGSAQIDTKSAAPSPIQTFLGAISAGVITLILYKFTTTIEAALNRQAISDNISVRQITVTIRTIVNGLCYLATFVFGINSVGLLLYSAQLAINSMDGSSPESEGKESKSTGKTGNLSENSESENSSWDKISDE